ncbi:MAG: protease modulator HflC, partial [Bradyrhizobium sp.]
RDTHPPVSGDDGRCAGPCPDHDSRRQGGRLGHPVSAAPRAEAGRAPAPAADTRQNPARAGAEIMKHVNLITYTAIAVFVGLVALSLSVFTVDQREQAIVLQLGDPVGDIQKPGLHFKIPFIQDVRRFDSRLLSVDPPPEQIVISSSRDNPLKNAASDDADEVASGEPLIVDTYARYRIDDPLKFMKTLGTVDAANQRIESIMNDATRSVLARSTMRQLLSAERTKIMQDITKAANDKTDADQLGIVIVDIRIVRADLTPELRDATVKRMVSELQKRATETRSNGEQEALEVRAKADRERTVILADATRDARAIEGDGDRQAIALSASAFNRDKDLYDFLRSMDAYKKTMSNPDTRLVLSPDNAFLKYFRQGPGTGK